MIKPYRFATRYVVSDELGCRTTFFGKKFIMQIKYYEETKEVWPYGEKDAPWERTGGYEYRDATVNDLVRLGMQVSDIK